MNRSAESCRYREGVERSPEGESARCRLIEQMIAGLASADRIPRAACEECCRCGEPSAEHLNPAVASFLYSAAQRMLAGRELPGDIARRAARLLDLARRHLASIPGPRGNDPPRAIVLQSCDARQIAMLRITGPVNRRYAERHGYGYRQWVGVYSGIPYSGSFNRYYLIRDEIRRREYDWALWVDTDALVIDPIQQLEDIIARSPDKLLIACRGTDKGEYDVNVGVFLINLRHPQARALVEYVIAKARWLRPRGPETFFSDQYHVHQWLLGQVDSAGRIPLLQRYTGVEAKRFNYDGPFIRHVLRAHGSRRKRLEELRRLAALAGG